MESSMFFGNTCQNGLMPTLMRPTLPAVQNSLGIKQFLPIPLDTASAVSLFPGFNTGSAQAKTTGDDQSLRMSRPPQRQPITFQRVTPAGVEYISV
ncbi:hypothetical protein AMECASPLE_005221 [Ameca splendens]|uniref:Uncharacterized protein n=1 Tax=Ameca splendens TaxID=208324 RepID=A0ABV0Z8I7_9TELE